MMTLDQIRLALADRKLTVVAEKTGLHYNTLYSLMRGENPDPRLSTIKTLSDYLEAAEWNSETTSTK